MNRELQDRLRELRLGGMVGLVSASPIRRRGRWTRRILAITADSKIFLSGPLRDSFNVQNPAKSPGKGGTHLDRLMPIDQLRKAYVQEIDANPGGGDPQKVTVLVLLFGETEEDAQRLILAPFPCIYSDTEDAQDTHRELLPDHHLAAEQASSHRKRTCDTTTSDSASDPPTPVSEVLKTNAWPAFETSSRRPPNLRIESIDGDPRTPAGRPQQRMAQSATLSVLKSSKKRKPLHPLFSPRDSHYRTYNTKENFDTPTRRRRVAFSRPSRSSETGSIHRRRRAKSVGSEAQPKVTADQRISLTRTDFGLLTSTSRLEALEFLDTLDVHRHRHYQRTQTRLAEMYAYSARMSGSVTWKTNMDGGCEEELEKLWQLFEPGEEFPGMNSERWKELGFQGKNPTTDFRGMGRHALDCLNYFGEHYSAECHQIMKRKLDDKYYYPFCASCVNIVGVVEKLLHGRSADTLKFMESALFKLFCTTREDENPCFELFCSLVLKLDDVWVETESEYMDFPALIRTLSDLLENSLERRPCSFEVFLNMIRDNEELYEYKNKAGSYPMALSEYRQ